MERWPNEPPLMKAPFFVILLAFVLTGCGPRDPIDRIVKQESANAYFGNGMYHPLKMPATASPTQVVAQIVGKLPILEVRQVYIPNYYANASDCYTAVLVDGGYRQEVVLLQYFGVTNNGDIHAGWWSKVYDLSPK